MWVKSIERSREVWKANFKIVILEVEQLPSGKWVARLYDVRKAELKAEFDSRIEAQTAITRIARQRLVKATQAIDESKKP
jgi:hypothetical protein